MVAVTPGTLSVCRAVGFGCRAGVVGWLTGGPVNVIQPRTVMAPSSNGLRRTPAVAAANGMTVRAVPVAYSVTLWPAAPELTPTAEDICGRTPAGRVSVRLVMNTAVPSASSADQGRTSR